MFKKQPIMRRVLVALIPCIASGIYFFGWRSLLIVVWAKRYRIWTFPAIQSKNVTDWRHREKV
jgi:Na+-transporting NADH:ubiquinone oxidoreductase subunit B